MPHPIRHGLRHDWPILLLVLANLSGIALYLGVGQAAREGAGYRVIDEAAVRRLLDAGDLSGHEALWYHQSRPEELSHSP